MVLLTILQNDFQTSAAKGRQRIQKKPVATDWTGDGRLLCISRLIALAIHCDQMIRDGEVADQTELARLLHVSQPRMTQIMNLLDLAPDLQEALLFLPRTVSGKEPIHEKLLRPIAAEMDWSKQRRGWLAMRV